MNTRPAVVLVSGGVDSATALAIAQDDGFTAHALSFRYGQRHSIEIDAARRVVAARHVAEHVVIDIDLRVFGGSALTGDSLGVPKHDRVEDIETGIPDTYVPARNTIFLSYATAYAEVIGANDIFLGVNAQDYAGYPDCRPEYISAFQEMARIATEAGVGGSDLTIHTPLIEMSKSQIIRVGWALGVDYDLTFSCYDPQAGNACGRCDACLLREQGFTDATQLMRRIGR